uniref:Uncharacterized protein n=1 Tax=Arundo donax TaxID=35708 RepID=A0A0A9H7B1_ARUDO
MMRTTGYFFNKTAGDYPANKSGKLSISLWISKLSKSIIAHGVQLPTG